MQALLMASGAWQGGKRPLRAVWLLTLVLVVSLPAAARGSVCGGQAKLTCDDGSACSTPIDCPGGGSCLSDCVAGGTQANTECYVNLLGIRQNHPPDVGPGQPTPKKETVCVDGAACDLDGAVNGRCTFQVSLCLGNNDPTFPECDPSLGIAQIKVKNGRGARSHADLANLQTRGRLALSSAPGTCSEPAYIQVPLKANSKCTKLGKGKKTIAIEAASVANARGRISKDKDKVKLTCLPAPAAACATVSGRVTQADGMPIYKATVSAGGQSTTTNIAGRFTLATAQLGYVPIKATSPGFTETIRVVEIAGNTPAVDLVMLAEPEPTLINPAAGGAAVAAENRVTFPPNAFQLPDGSLVGAGKVVKVTLLPLDPTTDAISAFPGGFYAIDSSTGASVILESIALLHVSATTAKGEPLQLAPGAPMQLELTIPRPEKNPVTGVPYVLGDQLPLWWLNPATGVWEREGMFTAGTCSVNPLNLCLFAESPHMSWINVDVPWDRGPQILGPASGSTTFTEVACLTGQVRDEDNNMLETARVEARGLDYSGITWNETRADGRYCVHVKRNSQVELSAQWYAPDAITYTAMHSPVTTPMPPGDCTDVTNCTLMPDLVVDTSRTCVRGKVLDLNGSPAAKASVASSQGPMTSSNASGDYCLPAANTSLGGMVRLNAVKGSKLGAATATVSVASASCDSPADCATVPPIWLGAPAGIRFVDNGDGTILDRGTGLVWETAGYRVHPWSGRCSIGGSYCQPDATSSAACLAGVEGDSYGCAVCGPGEGGCEVTPWGGIAATTAWQGIVGLNATNFAGSSDWRLPRRTELETFPCLGALFCAPDPLANGCGSSCPATPCVCSESSPHLSATTHPTHPQVAGIVDFDGSGTLDGSIWDGWTKDLPMYVRAVRGGL